MKIRLVQPNELPKALELVERVFMRFEAPDYAQKGVETFLAFLNNPEAVAALSIYGAFSGDVLIGVIAMRGSSHIALFFVDADQQGKGVGRALFSAAKAECPADFMTVHSSPFAVDIYRHLGFSPLSGEQELDGIRFTPMKYVIKQQDVL